MDSALVYSLAAVFIVSLISFAGLFALALKHKTLDKLLFVLIAFAAGSMLGAAFLDLLPESIEAIGANGLYLVIIGFLVFLLIEKVLHWRHCHEEKCEVHQFTWLSLIGDAIHNFIDGMIIAASFITGVPTGIAVTIAVVAHEIPQEIGDFAVLLYGGFSKKKALAYNFLVALTSLLGVLAVFVFSSAIQGFGDYLLPFAAGGFIYIAAVDLIPQIHKETDLKKSGLQIALLCAGIALVWLAGSALGH